MTAERAARPEEDHMTTSTEPIGSRTKPDETTLRHIADRVRWLSTAMIDAANHTHNDPSGLKVGGHQASSASMVEIMVALWFTTLESRDRVSVKPHASPVLHAINYLLGDLGRAYLPTLRAKGGLQSYPSRLKDPDTVDFSTGSVGIGATAPVWAAMAHRYAGSHSRHALDAGRFISLLGDAELDEGAVWEALADPTVPSLGELLWVVDFNRQSLDRVVPDIQITRLRAMFEAVGWQVVVLAWGRAISEAFERPGGPALRARLETMSNEEYQRMLRRPPTELRAHLLAGHHSSDLETSLDGLEPERLSTLVRDLGGHDIGLLAQTFREADSDRPTVIFAYTVKGRGLALEGHPGNHSALLSRRQLQELAQVSGAGLDDPWATFSPDSPEDRLCRLRAEALRRPTPPPPPPLSVPDSLGHSPSRQGSTQAALGRLLADLVHDAPDVAARVVTCSPDVASSTNLGSWINKTGVWSPRQRHDWFADDTDRILRWTESEAGQHIELGISEVNLVGLAGELGTTWSRWGERLIPIATLYDPFVARALEPWSFSMYAGGQFILVGTPSGVTLAPEGGAHQSVTTPSIGLEQPGCIAWEPAFRQDLEWCFLHAMSMVGVPGGTSSYFRLSTRSLDQSLAAMPADPVRRACRHRAALEGGYRISRHEPDDDQVTLVGVGAVMPEVVAAAARLDEIGLRAGVVCLTSPDLVFRAFRRARREGGVPDVVSRLFPATGHAPLVTVQDGHPHTLAFLAGVRGDRIRCLGVTDFGQSSTLADAYRLHDIDTDAVVAAALDVLAA
jgi:pyruvate dehydrogenase E1 component